MVQKDDESLMAGRLLASPAPGEEIVISGTSGSFPDAENVEVFADKLFNKVDLISGDGRRWQLDHPEIPQRTGKLVSISKFDAGFFGVHYKQANAMDPMCRILLEKTYEAVIDAGMNPRELRGKKVGVFVGACFSETEKTWFYEKLQVNGFGVTGCARAMLANRISYWLGVRGPSYTVDTACSSSLYALEHGYRAVRDGVCEAAIVAGSNLCLHPYVSLQFCRLGVLSRDGSCKCFDEGANGYCRSEGVSVVVLQKSKDAKRVYARLVHAKTNCDGYKEQGITYPSGPIQQILLEEFYEECQVDPSSLAWIEAHGTGTKVGDPEEVRAIEAVFCANRKTPLQIGSLKSNCGHSEPTSGLLSITKVIIAMETGYIPPNINFKTPRKDIEALHNGKITVVTEKTPWAGGMVGVNSFGFGGANCHVLLDHNKKTKKNGGLPDDNLPRLVTVSGRTHESATTMLNYLDSHPLDFEFVKLFHEIHKWKIPGHLYRGFTLLSKEKPLCRSIKESPSLVEPLYYLVPDTGCDWSCLKALSEFQLFKNVVDDMTNNLKPFGRDVSLNRISSERSIFHSILAQILLVEVLKRLGSEPQGAVGMGCGEIAAAFATSVITFGEALLLAHHADSVLGNHRDSKSDTGKRDSSPTSKAHAALVTALQPIIQKKRSCNNKFISMTNPNLQELSAESLSSAILTKTEAISSSLLDVFPYKANMVYISTEDAPTQLLHNKIIDKSQEAISILAGNNKNTINTFLTSLGKMFELGLDFDLGLLYPPVAFPVSRSTPWISPLVKWDHSEDWYVAAYKTQDRITTGERCVAINVQDEDTEYISGHVIDGRNLFPATGYLFLVWESFALMNAKFFPEVSVVFENVRFSRATNMIPDGSVEFYVTIQRSSGKFEIVESGASIVTGRIYIPEDPEEEVTGASSGPAKPEGDAAFVLSSRDFYKELRLRGYNYKGLFRSVKCSTIDGSEGRITWHNNWVAFMDNMLQLQIIHLDSRGLFVPTGIQRVVINPQKHIAFVSNLPDDKREVPVFFHKHVKMISAGGIEIRGMNASAISKRKALGDPVLEKFHFLPYCPKQQMLDAEGVVRAYVHIGLDNQPTINVKVAEQSNYTGPSEEKFLCPYILNALADLPLMQPEITLLMNESLKPEDFPSEITVEDKKLPADQSFHMIVTNGALEPENADRLKACLDAVKEGGFVITREKNDSNNPVVGAVICSSNPIDNGEYLILLRKGQPLQEKKVSVISVSEENFDWIKYMQTALKNEEIAKVVILNEKDIYSGVLGFTNCICKEGFTPKARCFFIMDESAPKFSLDDPFYAKQFEKDLITNVYKDGEWGSYRHCKLPPCTYVPVKHAWTGFLTRGDVSSATWIQGDLASDNDPKKVFEVYYSALNFRDVMTGTGKLAPEVVEKSRLEQECVQGLEFSGRDWKGRRIMGIVNSKGIANEVSVENTLSWGIPDSWTLEDAACVPCVYATIVYAFDIVGNLKRGESILIHAGSGGVGQAAIHYALHFGCKVYTTVGTPEKREFIKKAFPQLTDREIGNSRDTSFEQLIMTETNGRGVDIVMNSLAEEKLLASVRCLARGGRFLELGKFDIANNNPLGMEFLLRNASFHGIMLTVAFGAEDFWKQRLWSLVDQGLKCGAIMPFSRVVFEKDQVEQAIRHMAAGKHIGKVLIKIRDEEPQKSLVPKPYPIVAKPRFYCDKTKSYIIVGGLGGFGLELADWMVIRHARHLVLSSRSGVTTGYQAARLRVWRSYGVKVEVFTEDVTIEEGAKKIIELASSLAPVGGIFNLAVVLRDAIFENQNEEEFRTSLKPKAYATGHLDRLSRKMCPKLDQFVIFSSVSCGRGNAGQTNYGMANSVMERICEKRAADGLPACAIQWGAVGDVGLVANMQEDNTEIVIGGTLPQKIDSCLSVMDQFLMEKWPIVSSMVVAEKKTSHTAGDNIVDTVVNIIGLRDLKSVSMHSTLAELGMDSMMAVEIKQTLEREFEVFLTPQDIRGMTFAKLHDIAAAKVDPSAAGSEVTGAKPFQMGGIMDLIRNVGEEKIAKTPIVKLASLTSPRDSPLDVNSKKKLFMLAGVEGLASIFEPLAILMNFDAICIQYDWLASNDSVKEMAASVYERMQPALVKGELIRLVAYSFGSLVSLELCKILEAAGHTVRICVIDGSPSIFRSIISMSLNLEDESSVQIQILLGFLDIMVPQARLKVETAIREAKDWESRMEIAFQALESLHYSKEYKLGLLNAVYKRIFAVNNYVDLPTPLGADLILIKPTIQILTSFDNDYGLSKFVKNDVTVHVLEGNHYTVLENPETAEIINNFFSS